MLSVQNLRSIQTIRKRTVLKSVRNSLSLQIVMETFLRTSLQEMRCRLTAMMLKPGCGLTRDCRKSLLDQKKNKDSSESVKGQSVVDCMCVFVTGKQMINKPLYEGVLARLRDASCRKRPEMWVKPDLVVAQGKYCCSYVGLHQLLSGTTSDIGLLHSLYLGAKPKQTFSCFSDLK